ncbi:MAG TPA: hypothetical protein DIC60_10915 [Lachnospiraceae bacterium]|nr:hypothetical protein [Lachnospiraceae bacterium]
MLKEFAKENKYEIFDCKFGPIEFDPSSKKFNIALNGNVYGIWVKLSAKSKLKLWNEVRDKSLKSFIENIVDFKPII